MMWPFSKKKEDKSGVIFTSEQIRNIFKNAFGKDCAVFTDDQAYFAITNSQFMSLAMGRQVEPRYCLNLYDCNRYTVGFYADMSRIWASKTWGNFPLAFAMAKVHKPDGTNHALIIQVDTRGLLHFIEPQLDTEVDGKQFTPYFIQA